MLILAPDGSPRAINIAQAHALMVMPKGALGNAKPSIVATFFDPSNPEGFLEDIAYFDTEAMAHAGLAIFVSRLASGFSVQQLMESIQEELVERHKEIKRRGFSYTVADLMNPSIQK